MKPYEKAENKRTDRINAIPTNIYLDAGSRIPDSHRMGDGRSNLGRGATHYLSRTSTSSSPLQLGGGIIAWIKSNIRASRNQRKANRFDEHIAFDSKKKAADILKEEVRKNGFRLSLTRKGYANQVHVNGRSVILSAPTIPFLRPHTSKDYAYLHELGHVGGKKRDKNIHLRTAAVNADFSPAANAIKIRSEKHANAAVRDAIARAGGTPEEVAAAKWLGDFQIKEGYIRPMAERVVAQRVGWRRFLPTANSRHACFCAVKAFFRENPEAQKKSRTNYSPPPKP